MINNFIKIWKFEDAPKKYQKLSPHEGDENYIAFVPEGFTKVINYNFNAPLI